MSHKHAPRGPIKAKEGQAPLVQATRGTKCSARSSRTGLPCRRYAINGGTVCIMHGGSAPQVQKAARERLLELQHPAINALSWLVEQKEYPSAAYAAARDILDRTDGKPAETVDMNLSGNDALIAALNHGRKRAATSRNP